MNEVHSPSGSSHRTESIAAFADFPDDASPVREIPVTRIETRESIRMAPFLDDGKYLVSGYEEGKLRQWRIDGAAIGSPMDVGGVVFSIGVSPDGRWIVSGMERGWVMVFDAASHEKAIEFKAHDGDVDAVDVSQDSTRIATGSSDDTACVWSLSTGERLLDPLEHDSWVVAIKFSPDDHFIATATWYRASVRVYDHDDGHLLVDFPIFVWSHINQSIAWNDDNQLFVLSADGIICNLDVANGTTLSEWRVRSVSCNPSCITLASDGTFLAACVDSYIYFWDTTTQQRIGPIIDERDEVWSTAISKNYHFATTSGDGTIALCDLCDVLPSPYRDHMLQQREEAAVFFKAPRPTAVFCELDNDWRSNGIFPSRSV